MPTQEVLFHSTTHGSPASTSLTRPLQRTSSGEIEFAAGEGLLRQCSAMTCITGTLRSFDTLTRQRQDHGTVTSERIQGRIEHLGFAIAELRDMKMQPALERALRHRGLLKA
jgi:hypothetical protein